MIPDWRLPLGVDRGLWDYVHSEEMVRGYDEKLAGTPLLEADVAFCDRHFTRPGMLIDLGCGTGRLLVCFARKGFECVGVDLSEAMLNAVREKAGELNVRCFQANLVELDAVETDLFDYAACLFSTFGMIRGRDNRQKFLRHVHRILKRDGCFVLHVHNSRFRGGRGLGKKGNEPGDRTMPQAYGGADLTLHHFTRREIERDLREAGLRIAEVVPVGLERGTLSLAWLLPAWRTYGYLVAAAKA